MSVNSVGGAASLPIPLSTSVHPPSAAGTAGAATSGDASLAVPGHGRVSGQHVTAKELAAAKEAAAAKDPAAAHKQVRRPDPLPPLKGLTVAEIRAMLGVAKLPGSTETSQQVATASVRSALDKYV